jgi:hypothetical protein
VSISVADWGGLVVGLLLAVFGVPVVARAVARADGNPKMFRLVALAGVLKLAAAPVWIFVVDRFYGGVADANTYSRFGRQVAHGILVGDFHFALGKDIGNASTSFITGVVYLFTGSSFLGGCFVFAFFSFVSLACFYRAFRVAVPVGDARRYALLVFFLPSLLFWTSAIGKDALISLGLGMAALGGAHVLARHWSGFVLLALGLTLVGFVRPHVGLILFAGLAFAYPFSKARRPSALAPITKVLTMLVLVVGGLFLAKVTAHFFGLHSLSTSSVERVLRANAKNTGLAAHAAGGGAFASSEQTSTSLSPLAIPKDIYYILIRPLPFKAHGLTQLAQSAENTFVVGLALVSWRRVVAGFRAMFRYPYILAATLYSVVWIVLFASIGNLGLLAREKTSLLPLLLVLLCWRDPRKEPAAEPAGEPAAEAERSQQLPVSAGTS